MDGLTITVIAGVIFAGIIFCAVIGERRNMRRIKEVYDLIRNNKDKYRTEPLNRWVTLVDWDGPTLVEATAETNGTYTLRRIGRGNKTIDGQDNEYHGLSGHDLFKMSL